MSVLPSMKWAPVSLSRKDFGSSFAQDSSMRRDYSGAFAGLNRIKRG